MQLLTLLPSCECRGSQWCHTLHKMPQTRALQALMLSLWGQVFLQGLNFFMYSPKWKIKGPQCSCVGDDFCCCCNQDWKRQVLCVPQTKHVPPDGLWLLRRQQRCWREVWKWALGGSWSQNYFWTVAAAQPSLWKGLSRETLSNLQEVTNYCGSEMRRCKSSPGCILPGESWKKKDVNITSI